MALPEMLDIDADTSDFDDLGGLPLLHDRTYRVRSYLVDAGTMRIRGMVRDRKPAGLYVPGDDRPLMVHHMVVDLDVTFPALEIVAAKVVIETHPHAACPRIEDRYEALVGLSIARGFTNQVRALFGGPRGCTHTTALLQAMAPVAVQSTWSMQAAARPDAEPGGQPVEPPRRMDPEARRMAMRSNLGTCHVWAEDGDLVRSLEGGEDMEVPVWAVERLAELGRDAGQWRMG